MVVARCGARGREQAFNNARQPRSRADLYEPATARGRVAGRRSWIRGRDGRPILVGVTFRAEPGETLDIIGPSGSGKTTLGKVLVGALQPTIGTVRIDGARLTDWDQD